MSVQRTESSHADNASRGADQVRDKPADKPRQEPKTELVDRFRTLMQTRADGKEQRQDARLQGREMADAARADAQGAPERSQAATDGAIHRKHDDGSDAGGNQSGETLKPAELAALMQAQILTQHAPTALPAAAPQAAHTNPQALADMLERHVRQLAVGSDGTRAEQGQVLLRLNDATLPGTDLLLSKTDTGWRLRADVRSRGSFDAIQQAAPQLAERFAARNLGVLEVDPHYHG